MAIDDSNRLVKLFFDEEQKITLWYDKFVDGYGEMLYTDIKGE